MRVSWFQFWMTKASQCEVDRNFVEAIRCIERGMAYTSEPGNLNRAFEERNRIRHKIETLRKVVHEFNRL
jgi:hypothetical protein